MSKQFTINPKLDLVFERFVDAELRRRREFIDAPSPDDYTIRATFVWRPSEESP